MDEYFLQYLWNFQKFNLNDNELALTDGSALLVFASGYQNMDSGPDFKEARIRINELVWSGSVEIHYKSSDWIRHYHQDDRSYDSVILHVVWHHDQEIYLQNRPLPTLELKTYVVDNVELAYRQYISQPRTIRCHEGLAKMSQLHVVSMMDKALSDRLKVKSKQVLELLQQNDGDWEETTYQLLLKNFGFKVNQEAFGRLSQALPYYVLKKYKGQPRAVDSLLFGMSGYLDEEVDDYSTLLADEFRYLASKHGLVTTLKKHHWNRSRMRPANFPSVRLAQLSGLLTHRTQLFAQLTQIDDYRTAAEFFKTPMASYWHQHYDFGKSTDRGYQLGSTAIDNLMINSLVPILAAYAKYLDESKYLERAQTILEKIAAEKNHIIDLWKDVGILPANSFESQALIHQYNHWCKEKKCLRCNIGISILSPKLAP